MPAHLAESIPPETEAWAILWLVVLSIGLLGLFMVIWLISRLRVHRYMKPDSNRPPSQSVQDPWVESAKRISPDPIEPGEPDED